MTKTEAIEAMKAAKKVTHRFFDPGEWITLEGNNILTEEGYRLNADHFWHYRSDPQWDTDWEIYNY